MKVKPSIPESVLGDVCCISMARVCYDAERGPCVVMDKGELQSASPETVAWVEQYAKGLAIKARGLRRWCKLAKAQRKAVPRG